MRQKTYLKAQKCSKFHTDLLHDRMFKLIIHTKAKVWGLTTSFAIILSAVALPIVLKAEFNFKLIRYITIIFLLSKVQAAALIHDLYSNLTWKHTDRLVFAAVEGRKNYLPEGLRATFTLIFHSEAP